MKPAAMPSYLLLYVDNPPASASFYAGLLGLAPVENAPTFALFVLPSGLKFGLWSSHTVEPRAEAGGGGGEVGFPVASRDEVTALHDEWRRRGVRVIQPPVEMDFGYTFTALDPDGHRLRVFCLMQP